MSIKITKSQTRAVVLERGGKMRISYYHRETHTADDDVTKKLITEEVMTPLSADHKDLLIAVLVKAGVLVRFFDPEERKWMDTGTRIGVLSAPGESDGSWAPPLTLEEFNTLFS